jgi:hypothetical protein
MSFFIFANLSAKIVQIFSQILFNSFSFRENFYTNNYDFCKNSKFLQDAARSCTCLTVLHIFLRKLSQKRIHSRKIGQNRIVIEAFSQKCSLCFKCC